MRTHYTTQIQNSENTKPITVSGWINNIRDHGGVYFIDLRDSKGIVQLVANPTTLTKEEYEKFHSLRDEWVIQATGKVRDRGEGLENPNLVTGKIEIILDDLKVLSKAKTLPFQPGDKKVNEELRLKYRYLDLRDAELQDTMKQRSRMGVKVRNEMDKRDYTEIETPLLIKSSEGGAEEVYATSKLFPGEFYSLPQSPQMYKQMLMVGGVEKYYSFAKCFRAESARSDRNIEFTQIDMEVSFATREMIMADVYSVFKSAYESIEGNKIEQIQSEAKQTNTYLKFLEIKTGDEYIPQITYEDAMQNFGSDKPDLRFEMPLIEVKDLFETTGFEVFSNIAKDPTTVMKAVVAKNADHPEKLSRKKIKELEKFVMDFGAKGLAYFQCKEESGSMILKGPLTKMLSEEELKTIITRCDLGVGDIVFFGAGEKEVVLDYMGRLRIKLAQDLDLIRDEFKLLWVTDFPMFEPTSDGGIKSMHHPFTSPMKDSWKEYKEGNISVYEILSDSYDLVLNGVELGGGSVRIHDQELQSEIFDIMQLSKEDIEAKFGFFIEALSYGTPPHAGFAFGFSRLVMLLLGKAYIREVIAFPKNQSGTCLMTESPNKLDAGKEKDLKIKSRA